MEESKKDHGRRDIPPIILIVILAFTFAIVIDNNSDINNQAKKVEDIAIQNNLNSIEACERGNESRVSRIENYRQDINSLQADINLVRTFIRDDSAHEYIEEKKKNIEYKEAAIIEELASIREVRQLENPELVGCRLAYPISK